MMFDLNPQPTRCVHPMGMTRTMYDRHSGLMIGWLCLACQHRHFYPEYK